MAPRINAKKKRSKVEHRPKAVRTGATKKATKKATTKSMPARSNKGGAVRGRARAAAVKRPIKRG